MERSVDRPVGRFGRRGFLATIGATALSGCGMLGDDAGSSNPGSPPDIVDDDYDHPRPGDEPSWEPASGSPQVDVEVEPLVENLEIPWDLSFTGTGELYLTERTGTLLRFDSGEVAAVTEPADAIDAGSIEPGSDEQPWWVEGGEGGTLGVATHPDYPDPAYVYVYYTAEASGGTVNRVARYDVDVADPEADREIIVDDIPADDVHNGGRIAFGPDGNLWVCTGDAHDEALPRDPNSLAGKILRVDPAGNPLASNPDLGGDDRVLSMGHRNPQGIVWLPNDVPVVTEHGPGARDEVNVVYAGGDYGWPDVRGGPDDDEFESYGETDDVVPPIVNTGARTWAPTGAAFYTGEGVAAWHNRLLVGGLGSQSVFVVTLTPPDADPPPLDANSTRFDAPWMDGAYLATANRIFQDKLGRVRNLAQSPTGEIYAITSNRDGRAEGRFPREKDDVLVRITAE